MIDFNDYPVDICDDFDNFVNNMESIECGNDCGLDDISGYSGHEAPEITYDNIRGE